MSSPLPPEQQTAGGLAADHRLLVSSAFSPATFVRSFGGPAYSYRIVAKTFAPLLNRWAPSEEVASERKVIDRRAAELLSQGLKPIHLSFLPPHDMPFSRLAPNVAVAAWEYPNIPDADLNGVARENWLRQCRRMNAIITHTTFARDAFRRADLSIPIHLAPIPVAPAFFQLPDWEPTQRVVIDVPCYIFPQPGISEPCPPADPHPKRSVSERVRRGYRRYVKSKLPDSVADVFRRVRLASLAVKGVFQSQGGVSIPYTRSDRVELSGVVYTTIFNHIDGRKNWNDLITGFLGALADQEDATLVIKLVANAKMAPTALNDVVGFYSVRGYQHRCKLVVIVDYLSDSQMVDLARASTYYFNTSRAEGSCMPLQDFLAAGRPAVCPANTGMADSANADNSFLIDWSPEPTCWPQDHFGRFTTTWARIHWQSMCDQLRLSYRVAKVDVPRFRDLSAAARQHLKATASAETVWPMLRDALDDVTGRGRVYSSRSA